VSINSKEHTGFFSFFLSFFGGCGDLGVEVLGVGSARGFAVSGVGTPGCLVGVGAVFRGASRGAGRVGLSATWVTNIGRGYAATLRWPTNFLGWKYGQREPSHSPL
jgi:hypothetical protein